MAQHIKCFHAESERGLEDEVNLWLGEHPGARVVSGSLDYYRSTSSGAFHDTQRYRLAVFYDQDDE